MAAENTEREWVSFEGVDVGGDPVTWMFDATFLTSNYTCIYGRGCRGISEVDSTELEQRRCTHGAHLLGNHDPTPVPPPPRRTRVFLDRHPRPAAREGVPAGSSLVAGRHRRRPSRIVRSGSTL